MPFWVSKVEAMSSISNSCESPDLKSYFLMSVVIAIVLVQLPLLFYGFPKSRIIITKLHLVHWTFGSHKTVYSARDSAFCKCAFICCTFYHFVFADPDKFKVMSFLLIRFSCTLTYLEVWWVNRYKNLIAID